MFNKKASLARKEEAREKIAQVFTGAREIDNIPVKEYMIKWLGAFAPDMPVYDAKSFCLPKMFFKNYLWHAFSFQKTDCYMAEDAVAEFEKGFRGECFILLNEENLIFTLENGKDITLEKLREFRSIIVFTSDFSETFVYTGSDEFGPYYKSADMAVADGSEPDESCIPEEECLDDEESAEEEEPSDEEE